MGYKNSEKMKAVTFNYDNDVTQDLFFFKKTGRLKTVLFFT